MPNMKENFGLNSFFDDEETFIGFLHYLAEKGDVIQGYYDSPNILNTMGNIDIYLKLSRTENNQYQVVNFHTHCANRRVWEMKTTGIDITPKDAELGEKVLMLKRAGNNAGMIPIHILNADVLPSFLEDEPIKVQMAALPFSIKYYANENEYNEDQPETEDGKKWLVAIGSLFPAAFLVNHSIKSGQENTDFSSDDVISFTATVKELYNGIFKIVNNEYRTFIRCIADTDYGEIEFDHTIEQVPEEFRDNIAVGSVISGVCILSGDAAIYEYADGIVKNLDNNFKLLRYTIAKGEAERLRKVLTDDAEYFSESSNKTYIGKDAIIERFQFIHTNMGEKTFAYPATITEIDDDSLYYKVGTRCIVISYNEANNYSAIAFIDVTDEGKINKITISTDGRYHFSIDTPPKQESILDDLPIPESVAEPILARAKFHRFIDSDLSAEGIINNISCYKALKDNITGMLYYLKENHQPDINLALENLFGYLFAKSIENTVNESRPTYDYSTKLTSSYSPSDAFAGILNSTFDEVNHNKLLIAYEKGKQFFKDFDFYMQSNNLTDESFYEEINKALIMVQAIGEYYASKF